MGKIRIHQLAKKLGVSSRELIEELKQLGVKGKKPPSALEEIEAELISESLAEKKAKEEKEKPSLIVDESITVGDLARKLGVKSNILIKKLIQRGIFASINQRLEKEVIIEIVEEHGYRAKVLPEMEAALASEDVEDEPSQLRPRPPVITVMGHVDHGKTTLLDVIRETDVVRSEAGRITQHIGAYEVELPKGKVVFLDTPGHEAFTAMRARGAQVTDVVVLVVAADDGIMPQTVEAIDHARAAGVPMVVAINKIDKPNANPMKIKRQLAEHGLTPEELGGKTICAEVSATEGRGLEHLLEMLILEAEMLELRANPNRPAKGTVIEARLDKGRGPVATVLVKKGTLRVGDYFICGLFGGKVRALINDKGENTKEATPSIPVEVLGLTGVPQAGDLFQAVSDERKVKEISSKRQLLHKEKELRGVRHLTLNDLYAEIQKGKLKELPIIIKGDVQGSVEALSDSLQQLSSDQIKIKVIHAGVGAVNESDVMLASASNAIVIGFHSRAEPAVAELAEKEKVDIHFYDVIYEATSQVKKALEGLLEPEYKRVILGRAEVRQVFRISKRGAVAGSYVTEGRMVRNAKVTVLRDGESVYEGSINSLRRFKEDIKEVEANYECGISLADFDDIQAGDIIEAYTLEEQKREL
ncbi:translation initiation factor IF-2 [candidate division NPL-UPA2 bacterium]|nr:translation initiation factor IF-2 [candidate division NPL-UPA2 bacterium]